MKFVAAEALRKAEQAAFQRQPGLETILMDRAGAGLAEALLAILKYLDPPNRAVRFLAGPGNNGGDAFVAAGILSAAGIAAEVWLTVSVDRLKGAARAAFDQMTRGDCAWRVIGEDAWGNPDGREPAPALLVDALLGTGAKGEPRGAIRHAVDYLNRMAPAGLIVAVDLPTGMDADTGAVQGAAVRADFTVTMGFPKPGMMFPDAHEYLGSLWVVDLGLPPESAAAIPDARPDLQWISVEDVRRFLPRRARVSHKGTYGRVLLAGGSPRYPGAIVLAAQGAARSGAGLVRVATAAANAPALTARVPEAILDGPLPPGSPLEPTDSILAGPGLGRDAESLRLVEHLLQNTPCPLVLDADALAVLAGQPEIIRGCPQPVVLTPHPGELARLLDTDAATVQADRLVAVEEAARRTGAIVVLKGAGTLVARAGAPAWINLNGNPGMACGGSGDVLAGLLAGLIAQKIDPFAAACAAVWLHGMAGDLAALALTQAALKAGDLAETLPAAFRRLAPR